MTGLPRRARFGDVTADLDTGELWRGSERIRIQDLPFRLLVALLERPGEVLTRAELGQRLWPDGTFVDFDAGLNTAVAKLREALGDLPDAPRFVETVPKRGYRFIATVGPDSAPVPAPVPILVAAPRAPRRRWLTAAAVAVLAAIAVVWWMRSPGTPRVRVAVVTFDNETGRAELDRIAQNLTDSTVLALGRDRALAVIGNAAILRTARGFRDLNTIRDSLAADLIVVGQVQLRDDGLRVMAHLIRARDQAHVWVHATPFVIGSEIAAEREVVSGITAAVAAAKAGVD